MNGIVMRNIGYLHEFQEVKGNTSLGATLTTINNLFISIIPQREPFQKFKIQLKGCYVKPTRQQQL